MFRVGQKVVCVDAEPDAGLRHEVRLRRHAIYTVVKTGVTHFGRPGVAIMEATRERGLMFRATRFRPIVDRPTDISVFKEMLHPSKIAEACDV